MKYLPQFLIFVLYSTLYAQRTTEFENFIHITEAQGLSQNSVLAIEKDDYGFVWIGTQDGLNRFDGEQFTEYNSKKNDTTTLSNRHIKVLENDPDGYLWIGTNKGLNRFNQKTQQIERMDHSGTSSFHHNRIFCIRRMRDSNVWLGTARGLYIYNKHKESFIFYEDKKFNGGGIQSIYQDSRDRIWIGTTKGLFTPKSSSIETLEFKELNSKGIQGDIRISSIAENKQGYLLIGNENQGLLKYLPSQDTFRSTTNTNLRNLEIRTLQLDKNQNLWIGCFTGLVVRKKNGRIIRPKYQQGKLYRIGDEIKSMYTDQDGSVWIGANVGGLKIYNTYFNTIHSLISIKQPDIKDLGLSNAMVQDTNGTIYIGTRKNGVFVLGKDGSIHAALHQILNENLSGFTVESMIIHDKNLWIATKERGILVFDPKKRQFKRDVLSKELVSQLEDTHIYHLTQQDDTIAIGTFGKGLFIYNTKNKKLIQISNTTRVLNSKNQPLTLGNIRVLFFDIHKSLWIGTSSKVVKIASSDIENGNFTLKKIDLVSKYDPDSFNVVTISGNNNGCIFIGTIESGFFIGTPDKKGKIHFNNIKLNLESVHAIEESPKDVLWLSSDQGIVQYKIDSGETYLFNENYSLINTEFRNHSSLNTSNGSIIFGSTRGIVFFDPNALEYIDSKDQIVITDFTIQGNPAVENTKSTYLLTNNTDPRNLTLAHDESSFTISFSDFNYTKILNHTYEYRLLGLHDYWKTTAIPKVSFNLQKSGDYRFEVRNKTFSPVQQNKITAIPITIKPAPWRSGYAITLYILLGILLLIGIYLILRSRTELKHSYEIESLKNKKEKEQFQSQIEFFTNLSHDFRTPLTLIIAPLNQIIEKYQGSKGMFQKLLTIQRNSDHMLHLINQILDFRKIETQKIPPSITEDNIVKTLQGVYASFEELAKIGNYKYEFKTSSSKINIYYDSLMLERVFYNLISNAFKNTKKGGHIQIILSELGDHIKIEIKDDGNGIDASFVNKIFDRFFEIANNQKYKEHFTSGTGIGLHITKRTVDLHQGTIAVSSLKNKGSIFTLTLKKGIEHIKEYITDTPNTTQIYNSFNHKTSHFTEKSPTPMLPIASDPNKDKPNVLIVEDNDELRKFIADILKQDFNVEQAKNGRIGFKKAVQKQINLIISDVVMPEMNGKELCKKIKTDDRTKHIPVILLTSRSSGSEKISGLESGADSYITKPFKTKEFLLIVKNQLSTHTKIKEKFLQPTFFDTNTVQKGSEDEKLYNLAMKIVYKNINNSAFEISTFCSELGISRYKLFAKIKEWTGQTPKEFIQSVRLQKASQLLELGDLTVSEVCYEVGFSSPKYFATSFKKQFQLTPTEYASKFG